MAKPNITDFLSCAAKWRGEHNGVAYELFWHGRSDYSPEGTWCFYIMISDEQFYPEDWQKLRLERRDQEFAGSFHRHWSYENFPDVEPHGEWTFGEMEVQLGRDGKEHEHVKVGCDYNHLFDREGGYWQGREAVEQDAKRSIDLLCEMFPRRRGRCAYSGRFGDADEFYTAINGSLVLKSLEEKLRANGWDKWLPLSAAA